MNENINEITIEQVTVAANDNAARYIPRAQNIARQAFIEGVIWAQKAHKEQEPCLQQ